MGVDHIFFSTWLAESRVVPYSLTHSVTGNVRVQILDALTSNAYACYEKYRKRWILKIIFVMFFFSDLLRGEGFCSGNRESSFSSRELKRARKFVGEKARDLKGG